jgi:hypothetical protein
MICVYTFGELEWWIGGEDGELPWSNWERRSRSLSAAVSDLTRFSKEENK